MKLRSLGYIGVEAIQPDVWCELGPRVFGFGLADRGPDGTVNMRIDDRYHRIAVHPGERDELSYLGWEVPTESAFASVEEELVGHGVLVERGRDTECAARQVERMVHFRDPAGFRHEVFYGAKELYKSFVAGRAHRGFVTGDQGMGHVVLIVPDLDAMHAFLTGVLGFRLTDMTDSTLGRALFYRLNPRHHSLAIIGMPNMRGLHHVMVECNDLDDVGITNDLVQARIETDQDLGYSLSLGRHASDRMLSIYVDTPSGFILEYGWGGVRIDDQTWSVTKSDFPAEIWGHKFMSMSLPGTVRPVDLSRC